MLHRHPRDAGRVHVRLPQPAGLSAGRTRRRCQCRSSTTCARCASSRDELAYLNSLRFISADFVDFLRIFQFQREFISARAHGEKLEIVARGPQVHVMAFEIYVLAIVNELYFRRFDQAAALRRRAGAGSPRRSSACSAFAEEPRAPPSVRVLRLRRAPALLPRLAARGGRDLQARGAAVLQGHLERDARARARAGADRHDGARVPADLPGARRAAARLPERRARGLGPGVPRRPRRRTDRRRSAWTPSWPTSTSTSPSCSTACATIPAIRSRGARRRWRTTSAFASTPTPSAWCSPTASTSTSRSRCTGTSPTARSSASASAPT